MAPSEPIELDEPAAHSHTPPGWPIHKITIEPSGKAPKAYGPRVYRFGAALTLSVILPRRGWHLVKKTKNYVYLEPPEDQPSPPFLISIAVPTPEEALAIAQRSYAGGESWMGQLGEWPAWYLHERDKDMQRLWRDRETGTMQSELLSAPRESSLTIGEWGVWKISVTGEGGVFLIGILPPSAAALVAERSARSMLSSDLLLEGAPQTVELTSYERNSAARRLCLAHYGPKCQACGLVYEDRYGPIAANLIHVHHIVPLHMICETYVVDPVRDLIPLCANCHHIVHSRMPPYSVDKIRAALAEKSR